ncbi:MAG: hypothetical protein JO147_07925, partial [Actinobacteria bacterium]|nr:hypothetical protein [Actinomycetota bacterium]
MRLRGALAAGLLIAGFVSVAATVALPAASAAPPDGGAFTTLSPSRILDTRSNLGASAPGAFGTITFPVAGAGGVPASGAASVVLNLTVTQPQAAGYITAFPSQTQPPTASNVNFVAGATAANSVSNLVVVPIGTDGKVSLYNGSPGSVQLIADVSGYFAAGAAGTPGTFTGSAPTRVLDTRSSLGGTTPAAQGHIDLALGGHAGVPVSGVAAVVLNVTVSAPQTAGYITVFATGTTRPTSSNLNFVAGPTIQNSVPNLVVAPVDSSGHVTLYNGSSGTVELIADVEGYFAAGSSTDLGTFAALTPHRLLDTRDGTGVPAAGIVQPDGSVSLSVDSFGGVPATGVAAVVLNVTVTEPTGPGYVSAYADGAAAPVASNINYSTGQTVPNLVFAPVGQNGRVRIFVSGTAGAHVIADVFGYYVGSGPNWRASQSIDPSQGGLGRPSCATTTHCVVPDGSRQLLHVLDAGTWSTVASPITGYGALAVNCPTVTLCVGGAVSGEGAYWPVVYANGNWTVSTVHEGAGVHGVSCSSNSFCLMSDGSPGASFFTFDGMSWSAPRALPSTVVYSYALSCASASFCVAAGSSGPSLADGAVSLWNGSSWSSAQSIDADSGLSDVSCPTTTFCVAIDYSGRASIYDGTSWTTPTAVNPGVSQLMTISCPAAGACVAGADQGQTVDYAAGTWSAPTSVLRATSSVVVSCVTSTSCVAANYYGDVATRTAAGWSAPNALSPLFNGPSALVCPAADDCQLLDQADWTFRFSGGAWSSPTSLAGSGIRNLSCASSSFCFG